MPPPAARRPRRAHCPTQRHERPTRGLPPPSVGLGAVLARARPPRAFIRRIRPRGLRASLRAAASRAAEEAREAGLTERHALSLAGDRLRVGTRRPEAYAGRLYGSFFYVN